MQLVLKNILFPYCFEYNVYEKGYAILDLICTVVLIKYNFLLWKQV